MMRALLLGIALTATTEALMVKKEPVMKLRGGLAGIDANQVATGVMAISAANAGVMSLAPTKAGEMYGVAETKWTTFFAQWAGIIMFGQTMTAFLAAGGMSVPEAMGWGFVPSCVVALQDLLNDRMIGEMGMGAPAKFMPPLINIILTLGGLGKIPGLDPTMAVKMTAVWMGLNGVFGYFATDAWLDGWGGKGLTAVDKGMGKLMASTMVGSCIYLAASTFFGKSNLESFGLMMGAYALSSIDGVYISKTMDAMGVEPSKALFWAVIQAVACATIFF